MFQKRLELSDLSAGCNIFFVSGVLWSGGFSFWMKYLTRGKIHPYTWTDCKIARPMFHFCQQYSSSLLMIMSIEKCFALYFPLKIKSISTLRTSKKICLISALIFFVFNAQFFFVYDSKMETNGMKICVWIHVPKKYHATYIQIDAFLYTFIPLLVMVTANSLIILKFMMAKLRNRHDGTESVNQALSKSAVKGSVMLLTVSFAFIILTGPMSVYTSMIENDPPIIVYGITAILTYLNHSINGLLYCISGSRFRHELIDLFECSSKKTATSSVANSNITSISSAF